jgi:cation transporter-like permease
MVVSGSLLDRVSSSWKVFHDVPSLLILVPALLGLKGNLEMTLGARLCTHASQGELKGEKFFPILMSNLSSVQCQAIVVGAAASALAVAENYLATQEWNSDHALLLASSAITAASLASFVLSLLMSGIVVLASNAGLDPDNITAPIAGMLGDFCTLGIVCLIAHFFWSFAPNPAAFHGLYYLLAAYVVIALLCGFYGYRSQYTAEVMKLGWYPVLASMLLSNISGPISQASIAKFKTFALFQVVMNGVGGNLGSVLASKLSSDLTTEQADLMDDDRQGHLEAVAEARRKPTMRGPYRQLTNKIRHMGKTKTEYSKEQAHMELRTSWIDMKDRPRYVKNWLSARVLTGEGDMVRFARLLFCLVVPGQLIFASLVVGVASGFTALPTPVFLGCFILASLCQTAFLQMVARTAVTVFWRQNIDPDNFASPLVCGMGDLLGTSFMTLAFYAVQALGGEVWAGSGL